MAKEGVGLKTLEMVHNILLVIKIKGRESERAGRIGFRSNGIYSFIT